MQETHTCSINIRFADIDVMGHVNNAVYLSYFEQARMAYFKDLLKGEWDWNKHGILLARNEIDYKLPVLLHDDLSIHTRVTHIGKKSLTLSYRVDVERAGERMVCAEGKSVLVCFDYHENQTIEVPTEWREKMILSSS
jgi:acyl-CoA thioester hydrolase